MFTRSRSTGNRNGSGTFLIRARRTGLNSSTTLFRGLLRSPILQQRRRTTILVLLSISILIEGDGTQVGSHCLPVSGSMPAHLRRNFTFPLLSFFSSRISSTSQRPSCEEED